MEEVKVGKGVQNKNDFDIKVHLVKFRYTYMVMASFLIVIVGYLIWLGAYVDNKVANSRYFQFNKPSVTIREFVGTDENVKEIEKSLFVASLFKPTYMNSGYYIQKEIAVVGIAYEDNGRYVDYGNMVSDKFNPVSVKVITKADFETKSPDFEVTSKKDYIKLEDTTIIQDYLRQIGVPYDSGKTYYKFVAGHSQEKHAIIVGDGERGVK